MDISVIKEFLISLGFETDPAGLRKFQSALRDAGSTVTRHTSGMASDLLKWQTGILGAFASVSGAALGLADHVAEADLKYQVLATRMLMTQQAAKTLQIATDALGFSMDEIAWNPELRARFLQLKTDQEQMQKTLGASFEGQMRAIRDLRFEFTRLHVAIQYLAMSFVSSMFAKFGLTIEQVQQKLEQFAQYVITNMPQIGNQVANFVVPILKETWQLFKEVGEGAKAFAVLFSNVMGLLSGDSSIEGTAFSFDKLGKSISHVVDFLAQFVHWTTQAEQFIVHLASSIILALTGHIGDAKKELVAAFGNLNMASGLEIGATIGTFIAPGVGTAIGAAIGAGVGGLNQSVNKTANDNRMIRPEGNSAGPDTRQQYGAQPKPPSSIAAQAYNLAIEVGSEAGVDPKLVWEQWAHETGGFTNRGAQQLNNLAGIEEPGGGGYRSFATLDAFKDFYVNLIRSPRYAREGIQQAATPADFAGALKRGGYYEDTQEHYERGMGSFAGQFAKLSAQPAEERNAQIVTPAPRPIINIPPIQQTPAVSLVRPTPQRDAGRPEYLDSIRSFRQNYSDMQSQYSATVNQSAPAQYTTKGDKNVTIDKSVTIGDVHMPINQPGATPEQINQHFLSNIKKYTDQQNTLDLAQLAPY